MIRSLPVGLLLCAAVASAEAPRPEVAPFPLEIIRTSDDCTKKDSDDLQKLLPMMLRSAAASVPDNAKLAAALETLRRQDCNREDACLAQLATLAGSLYAFAGQVDFNLDGEVVASGRVVRDDGRAVRSPRTVKVARGASSFRDTALAALKQLLIELDVAHLPAFMPQEPLVEVAPLPVTRPTVAVVAVPAVPPAPAPSGVNPFHVAGLAGLGAGAVCMVVGGVVLGTAGSARTDVSQGVVRVFAEDAGKVAGIQRAQTAGVALLAVGAGLAVVGAGLALFGPEKPLTTVVPINGGAAVLISGVMP